MDLFNYSRRSTTEVYIGGTPLGATHPIRLQSMTNTSTQDTEACIEQAKKIVDAGGEYVRLTTQGIKEAQNLMNINKGLRSQNYMVPLIADVHFNPKVAEVAAHFAEKVRINPGNYVDAARTFKHLEYTEEEYAQEIEKIKEKFIPFLAICKKNYTAIRIGVNHGSLSDRIMSRYGDTPAGIVESCMEFLRICVAEDFKQVVISIKASNTVVMVQSVRLLVDTMDKENMNFPIHLGVTEAGDGEDGRIKSALGIGALLTDGIGDTLRVSLSEAPEVEIPVGKKLVDYISQKENHPFIPAVADPNFNYLSPTKRKTHSIHNIGGNHVPVVIIDNLFFEFNATDTQLKPDYIYTGQKLPQERNENIAYILDANQWKGEKNTWPAFSFNQLDLLAKCDAELKFLFTPYMGLTDNVINCLKQHPEIVIISQSNHPNRVGEHRALVHQLLIENLTHPVIFFQHYNESNEEDLQVKSASDMGALIFDGLCDGLFVLNQQPLEHDTTNRIAFGILQAGRIRTSKIEYISCPGCGRTLFNLEKTIKEVKEATKHLKGLKIGIMGCIVNGPGEMADADYGYVGAGKGKISLYKGKVCVEKNIPQEDAVNKLIELIKLHGDYHPIEKQ